MYLILKCYFSLSFTRSSFNILLKFLNSVFLYYFCWFLFHLLILAFHMDSQMLLYRLVLVSYLYTASKRSSFTHSSNVWHTLLPTSFSPALIILCYPTSSSLLNVSGTISTYMWPNSHLFPRDSLTIIDTNDFTSLWHIKLKFIL